MSEAHIRIDEGLKRGPRKRTAPPPAKAPVNRGSVGENFNALDVVQRYLQGEEIAEIAASYGVHPNTLNYHLLKPDVREAWKAAQVAVSLGEYQDAKLVMREAETALGLARARETARSSQWDLERLEGRLFGQKQEVSMTVDVHVQVEHALTAEAGELLARIRVASPRQVAAQQGPIIDVVEKQQIIEK